MAKVLRNEINTRSAFAKSRGEYYFKQMVNVQKTGNVLQARVTRKFIQAVRIYTHYNQEFIRFLESK